MLSGFWLSWFANMIAAQASESIDGIGVVASELEVAFGPSHEESPSARDKNETTEIHVSTIHQIERPSLEEKAVEPAHIVLFRAGNTDTGRDGTAKIDLSVQFYSGFCLPEIRPSEERQRQIDGRRVERIDRIVEIQPQILVGIERPGLLHQRFGEIFPDSPVSRFVGVGESRFGDRFREAKMVKRLSSRIEASRNVAQAFPCGHLRKDHAGELLTVSEMPIGRRRFVTLYDSVESLTVNEIENLRENESSGVHGRKSS